MFFSTVSKPAKNAKLNVRGVLVATMLNRVVLSAAKNPYGAGHIMPATAEKDMRFRDFSLRSK